MEKNNTEKNNYIAALVGFGLIAIVLLITFVRPYFSSQNKQAAGLTSEEALAKNAKSISANDLFAKINNKQTLTIIDVRDPDIFQWEHIAGSRNIPVGEFPGALGTLDPRQSYVVLDDGLGNDAMKLVATTFAGKDYKDVSYLAGGYFAWKNQVDVSVSDGDPMSITDQSKVAYISSDELKKDLDSGQRTYLIDVRKEDAFKEGHIKGAMNIYLEDLEKRRSEIPLGGKIVVYDKDGLWAFKSAVKLFDMGVLNVTALSDGLDAWTAKNYGLEK